MLKKIEEILEGYGNNRPESLECIVFHNERLALSLLSTMDISKLFLLNILYFILYLFFI